MSQEAGGPLKIAYTIQNVGGIDFSSDVGDTVPVKQSLLGLHEAGHTVRVFRLRGTHVTAAQPPDLAAETRVSAGLTNSRFFRIAERISRRAAKELGLRYYAAIDSYRFYANCLRLLPGYEICHEHNGLFSTGAARACRRLNLPYVLTFSADLILERSLTGSPLSGWHRRAAVSQTRLTLECADAVLCVSEAARRHLVETWGVAPEKLVVMPNGVDTDLFTPGRAEPAGLRQDVKLSEGAPVIAFAGGFQPWHGLEILVESFSIVRQEIPAARLLLIGDGRARPIVDRAIAKQGLSDQVIVTGWVPQTMIPAYLALADVAVLPYPELPMELWFSPLKLFEYMAAGKAIVASNSGQIAEVLKDGYNGVLVDPGDADALARELIGLLADRARRQRLGHNARDQAVAKHSWRGYVRRLETVYRQVLGSSPVQ